MTSTMATNTAAIKQTSSISIPQFRNPRQPGQASAASKENAVARGGEPRQRLRAVTCHVHRHLLAGRRQRRTNMKAAASELLPPWCTKPCSKLPVLFLTRFTAGWSRGTSHWIGRSPNREHYVAHGTHSSHPQETGRFSSRSRRTNSALALSS
jgi:hypothetical protein